MAACVVPFRSAAQRRADAAEVLRRTHHHLDECWRLRAESRALQRSYQKRQQRIEALLEGIDADRGRA